MKWMNAAAAATSYPTNGIGGVSTTATDSGFSDGKSWDNLPCILYGVTINGAAEAGTVAITSHDGTSKVLATNSIIINGTSVHIPLCGVEFEGLKVVCAGAGVTATVWFETGTPASYTAA